MNKIEQIVYKAVKGNPALKQFLRNAYQSAFDLLPRKANLFSGPTDFREGWFFGFHDVTPFSADDTKLLACHAGFDMRMPLPEEPLQVGWFDLHAGKFGDFHKIGESHAWNWHKGCRLQWFDDKSVIFNTATGGHIHAVIMSLDGRYNADLSFPIDAIHVDGKEKVATSFSYERLERCMPGYGYPYSDGGLISEDHPADTGLFLVDIGKNERKLLVSLDELARSLPADMREGYLHFVTHTEFSPDGRYISFLYRRIPRDGNYMKRWTRIQVYDRENGKLYTLPTDDSGSHYVWNSDNRIIASCNIGGRNCHLLFDMRKLGSRKAISPEVLSSDGHQTWIGNTRFLTDTYPDRRRMASIYSVSVAEGECLKIASVYSPKKFQTKDFKCHIACDLHPRASKSGKYLCFDSATTGKRALWIMTLETQNEKK